MDLLSKAGIKGEQFETKVYDILSRYVSENDWLLVQDLRLKSVRGYTQIDFLLLTPQGYYCIETKDWDCEIWGSTKEFWLVKYTNREFRVISPIKQNYTHMNRVGEYVAPYKLRSLVCFGNDAYIHNKIPGVMYLSEFTQMLDELPASMQIVSQEEMAQDYYKVKKAMHILLVEEALNG